MPTPPPLNSQGARVEEACGNSSSSYFLTCHLFFSTTDVFYAKSPTKDGSTMTVTIPRSAEESDHSPGFRGTKRAHTGVGLSFLKDPSTGSIIVSKCSKTVSAI